MRALIVSFALLGFGLAGCATGPLASSDGASSRHPDAPSDSQLTHVATTALHSSGHVNVTLVDDVAYVDGRCSTAIDENSVIRALMNQPGVNRVESRLHRGM